MQWCTRTILLVALAPLPVHAESSRRERPISIGVALGWPWISTHDATVPLPMVRLGIDPTPRWSIDVSFGTFPYGSGGLLTAFDAGARWFARDAALAPYAALRLGDFIDRGDETETRSYPFATAAAGVEYAARSGLTAWLEAGPAAISYIATGDRSLELGVYASAGLGYRLRR